MNHIEALQELVQIHKKRADDAEKAISKEQMDRYKLEDELEKVKTELSLSQSYRNSLQQELDFLRRAQDSSPITDFG